MPDAPVNAVFGFLQGLMRRQFYFVAFCFVVLAGIATFAADLSTAMIVLLFILGFALVLFAALIWFWRTVFTNMGRQN
jgi:hypothetical protein